MSQRVELLEQAKDFRQRAAQARRLGGEVNNPSDCDRLNDYAKELESKAASLEESAGALPD